MRKSIYLFDSSMNLIKIIPYENIITLVRKQELRENELPLDRLTAVYKAEEFKQYEEIEYIAVKDLHDAQRFHIFYIQEAEIDEEKVTLEAAQLAYKELKQQFIRDIRPQGDAQTVLGRILENTDWTVGRIPSTGILKTTYYDKEILAAIQEWAAIFNLQVDFKVEISGQKITAKWIDAYIPNANKKHKRFTHKSNALSIVAVINRTDTITGLIGRGKGEETESGGYGRKLTFADIEWKKENGNPVDKPAGQDYVEIPELTQARGINHITGKKLPALGIINLDSIEDAEELLQETYKALVQNSRDKYEFKTSVADIGEVDLGEIATIHNYELGIHYEAPVFKIERDFLQPQKTAIELGDKINLSRAEIKAAENTKYEAIKAETQAAIEIINTIAISGTGNSINYGNAEPQFKKTGDSWVRDHPTKAGEKQWLVWDGNAWEIIIDPDQIDQLKADLEENERIIAEAEERATANLEAINSRIDSTKEEFNTAISELESTTENTVIRTIDSTVNRIRNTTTGFETFIKQTDSSIANMITGDGVKSIIKQESGNIYLGIEDEVKAEIDANKMTGTEIKTAINLSEDTVAISGKYVQITGESYIANGVIKTTNIGDAQITSAKIKDVSADKLTAGTINAQLIKVINLEGNSLTTGEIKGGNASWDLKTGYQINGTTTGYQTIQYNGTLTQYEAGNERLRLNPQGLQFFAKGGSGHHTGIMMSAEFNTNGRSGDALVLGHSSPRAVFVSYIDREHFTNTGERRYLPYTIFDKFNITGYGDSDFPIKMIERAQFLSQAKFMYNVGFNQNIEVTGSINFGVWRISAETGLSSAIGGAGFKIVDGAGYGWGFGSNRTLWKIDANVWTSKIL